MSQSVLPESLHRAIVDCVREAVKPPENEPLWNTTEVAEYLGFSTAYLTNTIAKDPGFPEPLSIGRRLRWKPSDIRKYAGV